MRESILVLRPSGAPLYQECSGLSRVCASPCTEGHCLVCVVGDGPPHEVMHRAQLDSGLCSLHIMPCPMLALVVGYRPAGTFLASARPWKLVPDSRSILSHRRHPPRSRVAHSTCRTDQAVGEVIRRLNDRVGRRPGCQVKRSATTPSSREFT